MGSYDGYEFRINEYLRDVGFLETTTGGKGMPSWTPMRRRLREGEEYDTWEPGTVARAASVAARFGVTARRVRTALERVGLADVAIEHAPGGITRTANEQVDFARSEAYVRARTELGVRINLEGREPNGVVPPEEYEELRESLIRMLQAVETPDGEPFFETVAPREQYFHGDEIDETVDIVTIPADFEHMLSEQQARAITSARPNPGTTSSTESSSRRARESTKTPRSSERTSSMSRRRSWLRWGPLQRPHGRHRRPRR